MRFWFSLVLLSTVAAIRGEPSPWWYEFEEWKKERTGRESIVIEAYQLVVDQNLQGILNYTSTHEMAEVIVNAVRKEYPALDVHDDTTLALIKLQAAWWLSTEYHEAREVVGRFKYLFTQLLVSVARLKDIAYRERADLPEENKQNLPEDPLEYLQLNLYAPVCLLLAQKMVEYKEQGWSREQIQEVIREKQLALAKEW